MHLDDVPERERILQVACRAGLPQEASREQRAESGERRDEARVGARLPDGRMQDREVGGECFEVERGGDVQRVGKPSGVRDRQRSQAGRVGTAVDEPDPVLRLELDVAEQRLREIGGLR